MSEITHGDETNTTVAGGSKQLPELQDQKNVGRIV
jgi:hypothetical protein